MQSALIGKICGLIVFPVPSRCGSRDFSFGILHLPFCIDPHTRERCFTSASVTSPAALRLPAFAASAARNHRNRFYAVPLRRPHPEKSVYPLKTTQNLHARLIHSVARLCYKGVAGALCAPVPPSFPGNDAGGVRNGREPRDRHPPASGNKAIHPCGGGSSCG